MTTTTRPAPAQEAGHSSSGPRTGSKFERDLHERRIGFNATTGESHPPTTWLVIDLEPIKSGAVTMPEPEFLTRTDGRALIYAGLPHVFYGPSESLKSWAAMLACRSFTESGRTALYVDFEGNEASFVARARIVGAPDEDIGRTLRYIRPSEPLKGSVNAGADLASELADLNPSLVVLDGVSECYSLHGWDINSATDAAAFQKLFRPLNSNGAATILIDHSGKDASKGVVGSQHKRAGLDGAEYEFKPVRREGRGGHSKAAIRVTKDRYGAVREFAPKGEVGRIHVADRVWIDSPTYTETFGPDEALATALIDWISSNPGQSTNAIRSAVPGGSTAIIRTLETLEAEHRLRHADGPRGSKLWFVAQVVDVTAIVRYEAPVRF